MSAPSPSPSPLARIEALVTEIRDLLAKDAPAAPSYSGAYTARYGVSHTLNLSDAPPAKAGPDAIYPDPAKTPGATNPQVTQETVATTIAVPGWTKTIRPPVSATSVIKAHIMARDDLPGPASLYELDHLISLELGGHPSDLANLWCQPYDAAIPDGGAHQKDAVETALKVMIVGGLITLAEGQRRITTDWYAEYLNLHRMGLLPMTVEYDPSGSEDDDDDA